MNRTEKMQHYKPEIDGLRALAVLSVILFHFNILGFSGGFVGVDIFFVISGYLITSIIVKAIENNSFSFLDFYERRARRLLPAAFIVLLFTCIIGWFLLSPNDMRTFGRSLWWFSLFSSNVLFMDQVGYFDAPAITKPILHTWSLSVEEQFYLIFPIILLGLYKYRLSFIKAGVILIFALSLALSIFTLEDYPAFTFYMLPTRAWELMTGSLLAMGTIPAIRNRVLSSIAACIGLCLIISAIIFYDEKTTFPGAAALLPCLGTALIIWSNLLEKNHIGKILSWKPFVIIGLISYPLYLWHWPILVYYKYYLDRPLTNLETITLIVITFILSWLTWKLLETPVRQKRVLPQRKTIMITASVLGAVFFFYGSMADTFYGIPMRLPEKARIYAMGASDNNPLAKKCDSKMPDEISTIKTCIIGNREKKNIDFIIWGDSHANMMVPMLRILAKEHNLSGIQATYKQCPPPSEKSRAKGCSEYNRKVLNQLKSMPIKNIIISGYWWSRIKKPAMRQRYTLELKKFFAPLKDKNIWIFTDIPAHSVRVPSALAKAVMFNRDIESMGVLSTVNKMQQQQIKETFKAASLPNMRFIEVTDILCGMRKHCLVEADGKALYSGYSHLSNQGAFYVKEAFDEAFRFMATKTQKLVKNANKSE